MKGFPKPGTLRYNKCENGAAAGTESGAASVIDLSDFHNRAFGPCAARPKKAA